MTPLTLPEEFFYYTHLVLSKSMPKYFKKSEHHLSYGNINSCEVHQKTDGNENPCIFEKISEKGSQLLARGGKGAQKPRGLADPGV